MSTIAILHYAGPPDIGGVEVTMAAHARAIAAAGHTARIIAGSGDLHAPGIETRLLPDLGSRGPLIEGLAQELAAGVVSATFHTLVERLAGWLGDALADVDALMVHNVLSLHKNLAFTAALRRLHDTGRLPRMLAWCHDFAWRDPLYIPALHPGEPWSLLRDPWPGVQYVVVSEDRRGIIAEMLGDDPAQIRVVTPGVDLPAFLKLEPDTVALVQRFDLLNAAPLLLLPARVTRRKNIELAILIIAALRERGHAARLIVTGPPGPHNPANAAYLAELMALRTAHNLGDAVLFLYEAYTDADGKPLPVSDAMLADWYRLADGLLFPSRYEGFGIPALEAGLAGIPIFCSAIPPLLATAADAAVAFELDEPPATIAARIDTALTADPRYALRRRVRTHFTWEAIFQREIAPLLQAE
jgi:glycosyltransferase involved in cell wall biosynthesis